MTTTEFGSLGEPIEQTQIRVRKAARCLPRHGLGHAYGHVSARLDDSSFVVCAAKPMGLIEIGEAGTVVPIDGDLPDGVLGEVRVHQQIYKRRPDVAGIIRTFLEATLTLSTMRLTPRARHGFSAYFHPQPPLWDDPALLRNDTAAAGVAKALGEARAIVLRGNGVVVTGATIEETAAMVFFLEQGSKTELAVLNASGHPDADPVIFTADEAEARNTGTGRIYERMWDYLTDGDPE